MEWWLQWLQRMTGWRTSLGGNRKMTNMGNADLGKFPTCLINRRVRASCPSLASGDEYGSMSPHLQAETDHN